MPRHPLAAALAGAAVLAGPALATDARLTACDVHVVVDNAPNRPSATATGACTGDPKLAYSAKLSVHLEVFDAYYGRYVPVRDAYEQTTGDAVAGTYAGTATTTTAYAGLPRQYRAVAVLSTSLGHQIAKTSLGS